MSEVLIEMVEKPVKKFSESSKDADSTISLDDLDQNYPVKLNDPDDINPNKKTKICRHWHRGQCNFGATCRFAHGVDELRSTLEHYKTTLCRFWSLGHCVAGIRCRYAHGDNEVRQKMDTLESDFQLSFETIGPSSPSAIPLSNTAVIPPLISSLSSKNNPSHPRPIVLRHVLCQPSENRNITSENSTNVPVVVVNSSANTPAAKSAPPPVILQPGSLPQMSPIFMPSLLHSINNTTSATAFTPGGLWPSAFILPFVPHGAGGNLLPQQQQNHNLFGSGDESSALQSGADTPTRFVQALLDETFTSSASNPNSQVVTNGNHSLLQAESSIDNNNRRNVDYDQLFNSTDTIDVTATSMLTPTFDYYDANLKGNTNETTSNNVIGDQQNSTIQDVNGRWVHDWSLASFALQQNSSENKSYSGMARVSTTTRQLQSEMSLNNKQSSSSSINSNNLNNKTDNINNGSSSPNNHFISTPQGCASSHTDWLTSNTAAISATSPLKTEFEQPPGASTLSSTGASFMPSINGEEWSSLLATGCFDVSSMLAVAAAAAAQGEAISTKGGFIDEGDSMSMKDGLRSLSEH